MTSEEFAQNFHSQSKIHELRSHPVSPWGAPAKFLHLNFQTLGGVLRAPNKSLANRIAMEPLVYRGVRDFLHRTAVVTVKPTDKGLHYIDENHFLFW
jgi:hypothetical protein